MKKRFLISFGIILFFTLILIPTLLFIDKTKYTSILVSYSIIFIYSTIFFIGGSGMLLIYLIYFFITFPLIYYIRDYQIAITLISTALFLLNPLRKLQYKISDIIDSKEAVRVYNLTPKKYKTFFEYRSNMKDYYHLPEARKLYKDKRYYYLRQLSTLLLFFIATFLSIFLLSRATIEREVNKLTLYLSFYTVIITYIFALIIHKKGFKSGITFLSTTLLPPLILIVAINEKLILSLKISLASFVSFIAIVVIIYQIISYYQRVTYEYYKYYDSDFHAMVYANALYEPYVYSDYYNVIVSYRFKIDPELFLKDFKKLLVYANFYHFIITSYLTYTNEVEVYTIFRKGKVKRAYKFQNYLKKIFKDEPKLKIINDPNKSFYEKSFSHKDGYIVSRILFHADILKQLDIKNDLIISFYFYFDNPYNLTKLNKKYSLSAYQVDEEKKIVMTELNIKIPNTKYMIELVSREILLDAFSCNGNYIRVLIHTNAEKK